MYALVRVYSGKNVKFWLKIKKSRIIFLLFDFFMYICIVTKSKEVRYNEKNNFSINQKKNSELWENVL